MAISWQGSAQTGRVRAWRPVETCVLLLALTAGTTHGAGVVVSVNGLPVDAGGPIDPSAAVVIANDDVRVSRVTSTDQKAGMLAEVRVCDTWVPMTSELYGDWTFVDRSVSDDPTGIEVVSTGPEIAAVTWIFGAHLTGPPDAPLSYRYPFLKTVWLRRGDDGFFAQLMPLVGLPPEHQYAPGIAEHEIGFGGVWGPGTVSTSNRTVAIDEMPGTSEFDTEPRVDAARFTRLDDLLVRVLVPLPEAPLVVPYFDEVSRGGVYVHHHWPLVYGAYLYAAPRAAALATRVVCAHAWLTAPFALHPLAAAELEECGPDPAAEGLPATTTTTSSTTSTSSSGVSAEAVSTTSTSSTTTSTLRCRRRRPARCHRRRWRRRHEQACAAALCPRQQKRGQR